VLRGDYGRIEIGERTSIQDGTVVHTTDEWSTGESGAGCVSGTTSTSRAATIGDGCLIGSGSIVLNRARIESARPSARPRSSPKTRWWATGEIALGVPARVRPAPEDLAKWVGEASRSTWPARSGTAPSLRRIG